MKLLLKTLVWGFILSTTLGFRTYGDSIWRVNGSDAKLFVSFCQSYTVSTNDLPNGDPLAGATVTFATLVQSVFDDYNNLASTYIKLVDTTDSEYNATLHSERLIKICVGSSSAPASGGEASLDVENDIIVGCSITIESSLLDSAKDFVKTVTHEIGHCLGLDHPQDSTEAIMSYFSSADTVRLQADDKMGLTHLYPINSDLAEEEATLGLSCATNE